MEQLLIDVYTLIGEALAAPDVYSGYVDALVRVLVEARDSEEEGLSFTLLPLLTCQAAGGNPHQAIPVAAAWRALHIAAKLLDDVQDGSVARITISPTDSSRVINIATGFIAAAGLALMQLITDVWYAVQGDFNRAILQIAGGQHIDLNQDAVQDLDSYFQVIGAKSGRVFALAARTGARCATSNLLELTPFEEFGYNVGILIQIADDLTGFRQPIGQGDLAMGHRTLPFIYALATASPPERARLEKFLARAPTDKKAETQMKHLMVALGSEMYLLAEMARYRQRALAALESVKAPVTTLTALHDWLAQLK